MREEVLDFSGLSRARAFVTDTSDKDISEDTMSGRFVKEDNLFVNYGICCIPQSEPRLFVQSTRPVVETELTPTTPKARCQRQSVMRRRRPLALYMPPNP